MIFCYKLIIKDFDGSETYKDGILYEESWGDCMDTLEGYYCNNPEDGYTDIVRIINLFPIHDGYHTEINESAYEALFNQKRTDK